MGGGGEGDLPSPCRGNAAGLPNNPQELMGKHKEKWPLIELSSKAVLKKTFTYLLGMFVQMYVQISLYQRQLPCT